MSNLELHKYSDLKDVYKSEADDDLESIINCQKNTVQCIELPNKVCSTRHTNNNMSDITLVEKPVQSNSDNKVNAFCLKVPVIFLNLTLLYIFFLYRIILLVNHMKMKFQIFFQCRTWTLKTVAMHHPHATDLCAHPLIHHMLN